MQLASIHLVDGAVAHRFVAALTGEDAAVGVPAVDDTHWLSEQLGLARQGLALAGDGQERGANAVSLALAKVLAAAGPSFVQEGISLTGLEAVIDRGVGMLLRPPSRLFIDLGLPADAARTMPIRLDPASAMMGGAYMPAALVPQFRDLLIERDVRFVRRLHEAGFDAVAVYGLLLEMATTAADQGMGLSEAVDAVTPDAPRLNPPGARIVLADASRLDRETARRLTEALRPPKRSLLDRLTGRRAPNPN